jgi:hypothetical protein
MGSVRLMLRTVRLLDPLPGPWSAGFTGWISPASLPRCRSATRQLGLYRDRTFTGKPDLAYLDTRSAALGTPARPRQSLTEAAMIRATSSRPCCFARASAERPLRSVSFGSAPCANRNCVASTRPWIAATISGVRPA